MNEADIVILNGAPTQAEAEAVRVAIGRLVAEDRARASQSSGPGGWLRAARLEAVNASADGVRGAQAWRFAGRLSAPVTHLQPGRGDAR